MDVKDHDPSGITALLQELKDSINSKARKRAAATKFMFRSSRSSYFSENRMGKFLDLALNRSSAFKGAVGFVNDVIAEKYPLTRSKLLTWFTPVSKKIVYSKPSNYGLKNYCVALSGPPLDLNDYSLAPPTRRLQTNRTASTNG